MYGRFGGGSKDTDSGVWGVGRYHGLWETSLVVRLDVEGKLLDLLHEMIYSYLTTGLRNAKC